MSIFVSKKSCIKLNKAEYHKSNECKDNTRSYYMSKRQKEFHDSLANQKTRVRLYKLGKNWVKSGIKEIEMFKIMGLPFISHSLVSQDNQSISKKMTDTD